MWKKILIGVAAVVVVLVLVVATRPGAFRIERSINVAAPPEAPFALVNDFHHFGSWSPWEKMDPAMKRSFEGAPAGVGAKYSWAGNDDVGEGRMTIEKSEPSSRIEIKLEFLKPFEATNKAIYTFAPQGDGTKVTWAMEGENGFMGKLFSMLMDMDEMVGADFERGLASMKAVAESNAKSAGASASK